MEAAGGVLILELNEVELTAADIEDDSEINPGKFVCLGVIDSGVGINNSDLDRIFDPYFTTKELGQGTGMGLSVVHGIVHSNEGIIKVKSLHGEGTTFKIYFPRIDDAIKKQVVEKSALPTGSESILIVDDDASIANLTLKRLEILGYRAKAMTSSTETLEHFRNDPNAYDLVITDQTMPGMTGEKLAKELLSIRPYLPIILCTGYSSRVDADKASSIGIKAFIMKPFENEELSRIVRQVLDK